MDTPCPTGVDAATWPPYCLMLGDDALIYVHRLPQWCTSAPELEEEIALANIALDLLGQARLLLARRRADGRRAPGRRRGRLAFFRDEREFRNVRLAELTTRDFGELVARLLVFATWRLALLRAAARRRRPGPGRDRRQGRQGADLPPRLRRAWVVRLGDGTDVLAASGCGRAGRGLAADRRAVRAHPVERRLAEAGVAVDPADRAAPRSTRPRPGARRGRPGPADRPAAGRRSGRPAATACTPRRSGTLLAEMQARPRPPGGDVVTAVAHRRTARRRRRPRDGRRPGAADAHPGRPRHPARRRASRTAP